MSKLLIVLIDRAESGNTIDGASDYFACSRELQGYVLVHVKGKKITTGGGEVGGEQSTITNFKYALLYMVLA
ncbi:hypothetical protein WN55_02878 [Dufourea novaeangliae]|uniref:Uncharacterized protein n=1 Tax=Dufourea novaeangliae TaxID=178035 RepID=A0A154PI97_DUFNO|nr:hypothetical protein WN55_02878 [Dufourea novaeangliae]